MIKILLLTFLVFCSFSVYANNNQMMHNHKHVMGEMTFTQKNIKSNNRSSSVCDYLDYERQTIQYQSKTYHFCSSEIKNLFEKNTKTYQNKIKKISVKASQFKFTPSTLTVNQGDIVQIILTSSDVTHGFYLKAFNINVPIKKGEKKVIEFVADQKGAFPFRCSVYCGFGHHQMTGELVVQ